MPTQKKIFAALLSKHGSNQVDDNQAESRTHAHSSREVTFINDGLYIEQDQYVYFPLFIGYLTNKHQGAKLC